ncbi:GNAT family N-acetyltransferase [Paractinoplanes lichenicola]|uniref:GNAT family N-acetyltransferase n=1 Tax=Paractinoplanes lichenicola TaxID=2802976 RepID=UPI0027DC2EA1|nr:GNAT family N-acetyltransferase [Actinoplanes lichenicola]
MANLSGRPAAAEVGPFVFGLDPSTDSPHINYASPRPGAAVTEADVTELVAAFRAAGRRPRLEYVVNCAPGLEALLAAAGFGVEEQHEYLVCEAGTLTLPVVPAGFAVREPDADPERVAMVAAQNEAFGGEPTATDEDAARVLRSQSRGGVAIMAVAADGTCAGGGTAVAPNDGVSEVGGIGVRPAYRRRGLAGAITAAVTERLFAAGADLAWLEASGEDSWRVYERVGYRPAGRRLYMSLD